MSPNGIFGIPDHDAGATQPGVAADRASHIAVCHSVLSLVTTRLIRRWLIRFSRTCFAVFFALAAGLACQRPSQNVVEQMLEAARRGQDTSPFWMSGAPKQELFNVLHYEVMSERPLAEVVKPYLSALAPYHKRQIDDLQAQIEKIGKARGELEAKIPTLNSIFALGPPPSNASLDQLKKWDDAIDILSPGHTSCIGCSHGVRHLKLDQALGWREMADGGNRFALPEVERSAKEAYAELAREFKQFEDLLRQANDAVLQAPAGIEALKKKIMEQEQRNAQIDAKLTTCQGVAYKVRVDSTNKAGLEVHNLWTITAAQTTDRTWKVTYLFDEKDFAEAGTPYKEVGMLAMVGIF
jgi:prefoldin subunit 5